MFDYVTYIDTLYIYGKVDIQKYTDEIFEIIHKEAVCFLGVSSSRYFLELENGLKVGYCLKDDLIRYNTYSYLFQFPNHILKKFDMNNIYDEINDYLKKLKILENIEVEFLIQRLDYNYTFKAESFKIDTGVISRFKQTSIIKKNSIVETLYIGNRSNGAVMRLYNKSLELLSNTDPKKVDFFYNVFNTLENLYTFEFELHRKYLTKYKQFKKLSLKDIDLVIKFAQSKMLDIRVYEDNEHNRSLIMRNLRSKIKSTFNLSMLDNKIDILKLELIDYSSSPSFDLLINSISSKIYNFKNKNDIDLTFDELIDKINEKLEYLAEKQIKENEAKIKKDLL